ncbi:arabinan endo-1,5-alpha-L-arabinosidase, partial [Phenoliferia sp. Uapishka_3]
MLLPTSIVSATSSPASTSAITPSRRRDKRASIPNPIAITGDTSGVHDPSLVKTATGTYILYGSGGWPDINGRQVGAGIPTWTSVDRLVWKYEGVAFSTIPKDAVAFTGSATASLWAPDVTFVGGAFVMYYSASQSGSQNSGIFVATSPTGLPGSWVDKGLVVRSSEGDDWNAIDPHLNVAGANGDIWTLTAGSFWSGIQWMPLNSSNGLLESDLVVPLADRNDPTNGVNAAEEGSATYFVEPYFYLFTSWDNIRVARSTKVAGPYVDESGTRALEGGGTEILGTHGGTIAPGGQMIITDTDGPLLVYHYISPTTSAPLLGMNLLDFSSGWPVVFIPAPKVIPPTTIETPAPIAGPTVVTSTSASVGVTTAQATWFTEGLGPHGAGNATGEHLIPLSLATKGVF